MLLTDIGRPWADGWMAFTAQRALWFTLQLWPATRCLCRGLGTHTYTRAHILCTCCTAHTEHTKGSWFHQCRSESTNEAQAALPSHRQQDEQLPVVGLTTADRGYMATKKGRKRQRERWRETNVVTISSDARQNSDHAHPTLPHLALCPCSHASVAPSRSRAVSPCLKPSPSHLLTTSSTSCTSR